MTPKFQVFVSSTYEDLKLEREQVIKATLEMGHIPVGMEMFSAADEEQWQIIARQIDQSDYFVVVVAHRYGSLDGDVSYTEKEYDYAVRQGVPVLGFIIEKSAAWPSDRGETDPRKREALSSFKTKVMRKPVGFWSSADDLPGKYAIAFGKLVASSPRPGWVRVGDMPGPEVLSELTRLSKENAELRSASKNEALQFDGQVYWNGEPGEPSNGPLCPRCYDKEERQARMTDRGNGFTCCASCDYSVGNQRLPYPKLGLSPPWDSPGGDAVSQSSWY